LARKRLSISDDELFNMLTTTPAQVWDLKDHGAIKKDHAADIVITENKNDNFFETDPENILLILKNGEIKLFDEKLLTELESENFNKKTYSKISINNSKKYVHGNLPGLITEIKKYYPEAEFPIII
jgi:adenine deaminase